MTRAGGSTRHRSAICCGLNPSSARWADELAWWGKEARPYSQVAADGSGEGEGRRRPEPEFDSRKEARLETQRQKEASPPGVGGGDGRSAEGGDATPLVAGSGAAQPSWGVGGDATPSRRLTGAGEPMDGRHGTLVGALGADTHNELTMNEFDDEGYARLDESAFMGWAREDSSVQQVRSQNGP